MPKFCFSFYTGDWLKKTRVLTLQTKGAWIDFLCQANESKPRGVVIWSIDQFSRFWSVPPNVAANIILELETTGVADVTPTMIDRTFSDQISLCSEKFRVISRRMRDEEKAKENDRLRKKNRKVPDDFRSISSLSSQREIEKEEDILTISKIKERVLALGLSFETWTAFMQHREDIGVPLTDKAITLSLNTLSKLKAAGNNPRDVILQSIERGYRGLFAVKNAGRSAAPQQRTSTGLVR